MEYYDFQYFKGYCTGDVVFDILSESGAKTECVKIQIDLCSKCAMNTLEVLTLVLVIFAALTYIDNHQKRK